MSNRTSDHVLLTEQCAETKILSALERSSARQTTSEDRSRRRQIAADDRSRARQKMSPDE